MQDLIITSKGETPGAVFIEWNIEADGPGKAAMWEVHVRVGGTEGSGLTSARCPPARTGVPPGCKGGSLMVHLTQSGSAYIKNAWYWVADHDLDDPTWADNINKMTQTSVYVARWLLVESTRPSWLYGTSSENSVFYQYQFSRAANVLAGMIQSEQPYYQPTPATPAPFESSLGVFRGDPSFQRTEEQPCDSGWGLRVVDSSDITILGADLYSWFSTCSQDCLVRSNCQHTMAELENNKGDIVIHNLITIGAVNMLRSDRELITAKVNQAVDFHPFWSQLSRFEAREFAKPISSELVLEHVDGNDPSEAMTAQLSEVCNRLDTCLGITIPVLMCGGSGFTLVGYDTERCVSYFAKPICCKAAAAPTECQWRANVGGVQTDCINRCEAGEVSLFRSGSGGGLKADYGGSCVRGWREFCCKHPGFKSVTQGCEWVTQTTCLAHHVCPSGKTSVATRITSANGPLGCLPTEDYCCPSDHVQLSNCHWVGQGDCGDSVCNAKEITAATSFFGDVSMPFNWERKKSLCCTPDFKVPERTCARRPCEVDPASCQPEPYGLGSDDYDENYAEPDLFDYDIDIEERAVVPRWRGATTIIDPRKASPKDHGPPASSKQRDYEVLSRALRRIFLYARNYYGPTGAFQDRKRRWKPKRNVNVVGFRPGGISRGCSSIESFDVHDELYATGYTGYNLDHRIELQYLRHFVHAVIWGELADGTDISSIAAPIPEHDFDHYWNWNHQHLPIGQRPVTLTPPRSRVAKNPHQGMLSVNNRLFEILGASTNMGTLTLIDERMNRMKGNMFHRLYHDRTGVITCRYNPIDDNAMTARLERLRRGTLESVPEFLQDFHDVIALWRYLNHPEVQPGIQDIRRQLRAEIQQIETGTRGLQASTGRPGLNGMTAIFDLFDDNWWEEAANHERLWIERHLGNARLAVIGDDHPEVLYILLELDRIWTETLRHVRGPGGI